MKVRLGIFCTLTYIHVITLNSNLNVKRKYLHENEYMPNYLKVRVPLDLCKLKVKVGKVRLSIFCQIVVSATEATKGDGGCKTVKRLHFGFFLSYSYSHYFFRV